LIEASTREDFDLSAYVDQYTVRLKELIAAKVEGKEIVASPKQEPAPVINLMDALRKSVARAKQPQPRKKPAAKTSGARRSRRRTA
jgi:DNA end-binding protein Ku